MSTNTYVANLRVRASREEALRARLRLSAQLAGADLHPPGLAPSAVLLVRRLPDPAPGRLCIEKPVPIVDRTWERAVREALAGCLHQAVRPENGRVSSGAGVVHFQDEAEAWACWCRERVARGPSGVESWWAQNLESSLGNRLQGSGESLGVAAMWRAYPRLVPAIAAHLTDWGAAAEVLQQLSEPEAENLLHAVCSEFEMPVPPRSPAGVQRMEDERRARDVRSSPGEAAAESARVQSDMPPWERFLIAFEGSRSAETIGDQPLAHQQLFGIALMLWKSPMSVRSRAFQNLWKMWRRTPDGQSAGSRTTGSGTTPSSPIESPDRTEKGAEKVAGSGARSSDERGFHGEADSSLTGDSPASDGTSGPQEGSALDDAAARRGAYTATDLGGVLYLINVLDALDLPAAVTSPPVGEYVGSWAVLEALARTLLGSGADTRYADDPLWRVLAVLDGRQPATPAGGALDEAFAPRRNKPEAFRIPPRWLDIPYLDSGIGGQWTVANGRLRVWTDSGCVVDLEVTGDPEVQAAAEWRRFSGAGHLEYTDSCRTMPLATGSTACAPVLRRWTAFAVPHIRHYLAAALGVADRDPNWPASLFAVPGKLYTTATHVDLILPLDAARIDARVIGLDRSPGWWASGGRVVRFHFRKLEANA